MEDRDPGDRSEEPQPPRDEAAAEATVRQPARFVDWLFSLPFLVCFALILLIFDPLQRLARLFGQRAHEVIVGLLQASLVGAFHLCGTRLEVERSPAVAPRTPYIIIANHQSLFDIPILGALLFTNFPKYVSKQELARWIPSISYNLRRGGNGIIDRADRATASQVIRDLGARSQARGVSVVIYPEGTRARKGELGRFRPAGTLALLESAPKLAVVPVTIDGSWRLLQHNLMPVPFGVRIRLRFSEPIERSAEDDGAAILERSRAEIEATLRCWRLRAGEAKDA